MRNDLSLYDAEDAWWRKTPGWLRTLRNVVPARLDYLDRSRVDWRGKRVVDVGCGGGYFAEALCARGARVVGVDPSAPAIAAARAHAAGRGLAIEYRVGGAEALPLPDASVDGAACVDVLEHVDDVGAVVREVARVLRPGGTFFFDTINRTPLATLLMVRLGEDVLRWGPRGLHDPARFVRPIELRRALERSEFRRFAVAGFGPVALDGRGLVRFGRWPVTWMQYFGRAVRA